MNSGSAFGSIFRKAYSRWACWTQADPDPSCVGSGTVDSNTGAQWHMLPQSYPNYKTVHRRFQTWCCNEILRLVLTDVANELRENGALDEEEMLHRCDVRYGQRWRGRNLPTKRGKGMKIMAIVDRHGLPLSVSTHAANHHEVRRGQCACHQHAGFRQSNLRRLQCDACARSTADLLRHGGRFWREGSHRSAEHRAKKAA